MQRNHVRKKWKKVRRLWEEHQDLRSSEREVLQVKDARLRDEARTPSEKRNLKIVQALLNGGVGGEPKSRQAGKLSPPERIQTNARGRIEESLFSISEGGKIRKPPKQEFSNEHQFQAPFLQIDEEEYLRQPSLHDYYSRDPEWIDKEGRRVFTRGDVFSLCFRFLSGWIYLPPEHKRSFDSEVRSRQAEIKQRITEITEMRWWTAVQVAYERSTNVDSIRNPEDHSWQPDERDKIQEEIWKKQIGSHVERVRIDFLEERRGEHRYWEQVGGGDQRHAEPEGTFGRVTSTQVSESTIDDYRRIDNAVSIEEKLSE